MAARDYRPPNGLRTRGTVIILPGRGETTGVYARLGSRLACDAYRVRVAELPAMDPADVAAFRRGGARRAAGYRARYDGGWEDELNIRTHCPAHRGVLADATAVQPGRLAAVVPDELLDAAYQSTADVPQLLLTWRSWRRCAMT